MSQLYHKNCGGAVAAGFQITMRVLSFSIVDRSMQPGAVEARPRTSHGVLGDDQTCVIGFFCTKCEKEFTTKEEMQDLEAGCGFCGKRHPVSETLSTAYTPLMGASCLEEFLSIENKFVPKGCRKTPLINILMAKQVNI